MATPCAALHTIANNRRVRCEEIERRAQREAHSEAANEHAGLLQRPHPFAGERSQRLLRAMHSARHKAFAIGEYDVLVVATGQLQDGALGSECLTEYLRVPHEFDLIGEESLSQL